MGNELLIKFVIGRYSQEEININMSHWGIIFKPTTHKPTLDNLNQAQAAQKSEPNGCVGHCLDSLIIDININLRKSVKVVVATSRLITSEAHSELRQWPLQLHLNANALCFPYLFIVLLANCCAYAMGNFHSYF